MSPLNALLQLHASSALGNPLSKDDTQLLLLQYAPLGKELAGLLQSLNGFMAFDSALHVFPLSAASQRGLVKWNSPETWKQLYSIHHLPELVCFAEDAFGEQFCYTDGGVHRFDPETAKLTLMAKSLEDWAETILEDPDFQTGRPLAREWQAVHGELCVDDRLVPKIPFVLGGEFHGDNLTAMNAVTAMRFRADIANQINQIPDGSAVRLKVIN